MHAKKILAAVDFSASTAHVIQYAAALAVDAQARLIILHVQEEPFVSAVGSPLDFELPSAELVEALEKIVPVDTAVDFEHHLIAGSPATEIVRFAEERRVDMIVVGTHGRRGWRNWLMGSVAETVVRTATCPVLTVRRPPRDEEEGLFEDVAHALPPGPAITKLLRRPSTVTDRTLAHAAAALADLRVRDVMARHVVEAKRDDLMTDIAVSMVRHELSGVPVVDEQQHCVGMLTAADFMRRLAPEPQADPVAQRREAREMLEEFSARALTAEELADDRVFLHMTEAIQTIAPEATIAEAAQQMCAAHIHRLPVVDAEGAVLGIVSSLDLVAALSVALSAATAQLADESAPETDQKSRSRDF
ncbi:MAG: universal stress protein [Planctomycetales bacterium]|nr:universal stress protein [Planctomycetales bacterium]